MAVETDRELVLAARAGRPGAFDGLVVRHWRPAWKAAYALTGSHAAAEDAVQEAFVKALARFATFDVSKPFGPWIRRIAVNCALDDLRSRRASRARERRADRPSAPEPPDGGWLWSALGGLRSDRRTPIVLHHVLGYSFDEVAELLQIPRGTVASRVNRGLAELRHSLEVPDVR
jgi:RNA polymerase sigma-70 factor (ECF subfamily)